MSRTKIEWATDVWNPVRGCSRVSEGCRHCYAERMAARFSGMMGNPSKPRDTTAPFFGFIGDTGHWTGRIELIESQLEIPLHWRKPKRIFVNSMSDLFHEALPDKAIDRVFAVMALCPRHRFMILTKRAERMTQWFERLQRIADDWAPKTKTNRFTAADVLNLHWMYWKCNLGPAFPYHPWPFPNVWLGVSVEDQATADERIPLLLQTPAAVRFVSYEPALGPVDLARWMRPNTDSFGIPYPGPDPRLDWVIAGGESGPGARPAHPEWFRSVRGQCVAAGVPYFFKQWGEWAPGISSNGWIYPLMNGPHFMAQATSGKTHLFPDGFAALRIGKKSAGRLLDGREWNQFPEAR